MSTSIHGCASTAAPLPCAPRDLALADMQRLEPHGIRRSSHGSVLMNRAHSAWSHMNDIKKPAANEFPHLNAALRRTPGGGESGSPSNVLLSPWNTPVPLKVPAALLKVPSPSKVPSPTKTPLPWHTPGAVSCAPAPAGPATAQHSTMAQRAHRTTPCPRLRAGIANTGLCAELTGQPPPRPKGCALVAVQRDFGTVLRRPW